MNTEHREFWAGEFGSDYTDRNASDPSLRRPFFEKILRLAPDVRSVCELGSNRGDNLAALSLLRRDLVLTGIEINDAAAALLRTRGIDAEVICSSIEEYVPIKTFDLVFTCGVLIHLDPAMLTDVYRKMFELSERYILINEYFNPTPVEVPYRGHRYRLFKRDFAGEFLDATGNTCSLIECGFLWKRHEQVWDDTTWFLFKK